MVSGLPKVDFGFVFETPKGGGADIATQMQKRDEDLLERIQRAKMFQAQLASKANTDVEQKFGQLYQLTNQEIDGTYADAFQAQFKASFDNLATLAQKNDPTFFSERQKVAQNIVNFKNQIGQTKSYRDQLKTILEDPKYDWLNKNQFTEYFVKSRFYDPQTGTILPPDKVQPFSVNDIDKEVYSMTNPFINKEKVIGGLVSGTQFVDGTTVSEKLLNSTQKQRTTVETKLPTWASYSQKTGVAIDPAKLKESVELMRGKVPGLDQLLNSMGNDYTKLASEISLNQDFVKAAGVKLGNATLVDRPNVTNINNKPDATYMGANKLIDAIGKNPSNYGSLSGTSFDVSDQFRGFETTVPNPATGGVTTIKKSIQQVLYNPGGKGAGPTYTVTFGDGTTQNYIPNAFKTKLMDASSTSNATN